MRAATAADEFFSMLEPSPILFAFIFVQRFVYFELLGLLALLRLISGRGWARLPALVTVVICGLVIFVTFAPALNLHTGAVFLAGAPILALQGGLILPLVTSGLFATSLLIPTRRWRWIDLAHLAGVAAFLVLWLATRI
jgi:hypothetical protein